MQERLDGRAASKVGAFGAIHGHFRVSRGLWRRNRLRNEQAFQARRQWNTCLYSLSLDLREYGTSYPTGTPLVLDEGGAAFAAFGVRKVPSVALIDASGRLLRVLGPDDADLTGTLEALRAKAR